MSETQEKDKNDGWSVIIPGDDIDVIFVECDKIRCEDEVIKMYIGTKEVAMWTKSNITGVVKGKIEHNTNAGYRRL